MKLPMEKGRAWCLGDEIEASETNIRISLWFFSFLLLLLSFSSLYVFCWAYIEAEVRTRLNLVFGCTRMANRLDGRMGGRIDAYAHEHGYEQRITSR